jgi:hypothetical protein
MKEIIEKIKSDYQQLKSLSVSEDGDGILLKGVRYRSNKNNATLTQVNYLMGMDNVDARSRSNLLKGNKWFMSACISIAKNYPNTKFYVIL